MRTVAAGLAFVVLFAVAALVSGVLQNPNFTPDGIAYARFAARDAHFNERDATLAARAFYEKSPLMMVRRYRELVEVDSSVSFTTTHIFDNRVLYPWLVSLLLPAAGFRALFIVSALAYVAFGIALFWMLTTFGRPWIAVCLCAAALALPLTRWLAASDLTDMLAAVWWVVALGALLRLLHSNAATLAITLAVASVLLILTRPTPYLVLVPALAAAIAGRSFLPLTAAAGAVTYFAVAALTHAFGAAEQLRWIYSYERGAYRATPFDSWYASSLWATLRFTAGSAVRTFFPLVALGAGAIAAILPRVRAEAIVLFAAAAACLIAIPLNPVPSAVPRVVGFPLVPVLCAMMQCFAAAQIAQRAPAAVQPAQASL